MSDIPQGPGWWRASDGRLYPPELHPSHQAPPPFVGSPPADGPQNPGLPPLGSPGSVPPITPNLSSTPAPAWGPPAQGFEAPSRPTTYGRRPVRPAQRFSGRELASTLAAVGGIAAVGHAAWTIVARDAVWADAPWPQFVLPAIAICLGLMGRPRWGEAPAGRARALVGLVAGVAALVAVPAGTWLVDSRDPGPVDFQLPGPAGPVEGAPADPGDPGTADRFCEAARQLDEQEDRLNGAVNDMALTATDLDSWTAGWQGVLALMESELPALEASYEMMKADRPALAADIDLVSEFSITLFEALSRVSSPVEFESALELIDVEAATAAAQATLRLDAVTRAECGIVLAD